MNAPNMWQSHCLFYVIMKGEPIWTVVSSVPTPGKHRADSRDVWPPHRRRHARCVDDEGAARAGGGHPNTEPRAHLDAPPLLRFGALPPVHELKRRRKVVVGGGWGVCHFIPVWRHAFSWKSKQPLAAEAAAFVASRKSVWCSFTRAARGAASLCTSAARDREEEITSSRFYDACRGRPKHLPPQVMLPFRKLAGWCVFMLWSRWKVGAVPPLTGCLIVCC